MRRRGLGIRSITSRHVILFVVIAVLTIASSGAIGLLVQSQRSLFSGYLNAYLTIHRFRMTLTQSANHADRYLRDSSSQQLTEYESELPRIWALYRQIQSSATNLLEDYFQTRAIQFGLLEYFSTVDRALSEQRAGTAGAYATFVRAQRIAAYVDSYAERLLEVRFDVGESELSQLSRRATTITVASGAVMLLLVVAMIAFAFVFARTVTRPITELARTAHAIAEGDLDAPLVEVRTRDEVSTLAEAFSVMQRNIKRLIDDLEGKRELEIRAARLSESLREAQLAGLQAQINPHFLFNTLNAIARTSLFEGAKSTTDLIQSLARVFRYMLQQSSATVSLRDELRIAEEYVKLQKQRFHERLEFNLTCDMDPDTVQLPALTLQPLIENAIRHGIEPSERGGAVSIVCTRTDNLIRITVADTGEGMHAESLPHGPHDAGNGVGLRNVRARLELLFGEQLEFEITSQPRMGTTVTMSFPDSRE
jgi:sensor histidine kinase YesM